VVITIADVCSLFASIAWFILLGGGGGRNMWR
jgi:hypothetical protein